MRRQPFFITIFLLAVLCSEGCSSPRTIRQSFQESSRGLPPALQDGLLEAVQIIKLLEEYRSALERKDGEQLAACFSPHYSYYDKDRAWALAQLRKNYFERFARLSVSFRGIGVEVVKREPSLWLRQEAFDWLNRPEADEELTTAYLISLRSPWGSADVLFGEERSRRSASARGYPPSPAVSGAARSLPPSEAEKIIARLQADPSVSETMGEVAFDMVMKAVSGGAEGKGGCACILGEKIVFLLEKENGRWKIISQE